MIEHLKTTAESLGLPFGPRTTTYNSRLAQELGLWAEDKGCGTPFHLAAFKAYFVDGLNLAKQAVLLDLVREVGLPVTEAEKVLTDRSYRQAVDRDWDESRLRGITAVPTFIMGQHKLVGAQQYESLSDLVTQYGAETR
jgi:predicted DsbA family dithiol-disulfide isomerase